MAADHVASTWSWSADLSIHTPWPVLLPDGIIRGKSTNKWRCMSYWIQCHVGLDFRCVPYVNPMQVGVIFTLLPFVRPRPSPRVAACAVEPVTGLVVLIGAKLEVWAWWLLGCGLGEIGKNNRVIRRIIEPSKGKGVWTCIAGVFWASKLLYSFEGSMILQGTKEIWDNLRIFCWSLLGFEGLVETCQFLIFVLKDFLRKERIWISGFQGGLGG